MSSSEHKRREEEGARSAAEQDKARRPFSRAQKHSRRVRFLKIFLPAAAAVAAGLFSWFTFFAVPESSGGKAVITLNGSESGQSNKLVMTAPKVEGYTKDNRPYAIKAQKAVQDPANPGIIELQTIAGSVPLGKGGNAEVAAASALFDNINGRLQFNRPFTVLTADGMRARLLSADVNIQSGQMMTSDKVEIESATQNLTAASMRITDSGRVIYFGGGVHIVLSGKAEKPAADLD